MLATASINPRYVPKSGSIVKSINFDLAFIAISTTTFAAIFLGQAPDARCLAWCALILITPTHLTLFQRLPVAHSAPARTLCIRYQL